MTNGGARKRPGMRRFRRVPAGSQVTIVIHGRFDRHGDEVGEIIDNAMHDAGLCGCAGPANGYLLSVETSMASDRHGPSKDHDGRETARAWIVDGALGSSDEDGGGRAKEPSSAE